MQDYLEPARLEREARAAARRAKGMATDLRRNGAGMEPAARRELASAARASAARAAELASQCEDALKVTTFVVQSHFYAIRDGVAHAASLARDTEARIDRYMERYEGAKA